MIQSRIRAAKFKRLQTVENFDFKHSKTAEKIEKTYLSMHQGISSENLPSAVFTGHAGTGKTHLARSLGYAACQKGLSVLFITAAEMVNRLQHAQKTYNLESELTKYRKPQVLIIDELGYVALDTPASNLFFQVISSRHDAELGTIATTNLPFGQFNQIFANDAIAHAIVDRLVNDAEVFYMEGDSYRPHQRQEKLKRKKQNA
jgi:DNA replication protein DnaC